MLKIGALSSALRARLQPPASPLGYIVARQDGIGVRQEIASAKEI